jgi:ClpP class serine protease
MRKIVPAALAAFLAFAAPASADPAAVRATIEAQLDAFRAGDAAAAYAYAAPSIKRMFPTPERFIGMVRRGYAPVYEANSPVFLRARDLGEGRYAQEVGLVDGEGQSWTALYTLARQDDGSWRITGCYLRKAPGQTI